MIRFEISSEVVSQNLIARPCQIAGQLSMLYPAGFPDLRSYMKAALPFSDDGRLAALVIQLLRGIGDPVAPLKLHPACFF